MRLKLKGESLYASGIEVGKNNPCGICKLGWIGAWPFIVKSNARIVLKIIFQTSFKHIRIILLKKLGTKKVGESS